MEKDCYNKQKTIIIMKVEKSGQKIHYHNNGGKEKKLNITNTIRHCKNKLVVNMGNY